MKKLVIAFAVVLFFAYACQKSPQNTKDILCSHKWTLYSATSNGASFWLPCDTGSYYVFYEMIV